MDAEWNRRERFKFKMKAEIMGQPVRQYEQVGIKTCNSLVCVFFKKKKPQETFNCSIFTGPLKTLSSREPGKQAEVQYTSHHVEPCHYLNLKYNQFRLLNTACGF